MDLFKSQSQPKLSNMLYSAILLLSTSDTASNFISGISRDIIAKNIAQKTKYDLGFWGLTAMIVT